MKAKLPLWLLAVGLMLGTVSAQAAGRSGRSGGVSRGRGNGGLAPLAQRGRALGAITSGYGVGYGQGFGYGKGYGYGYGNSGFGYGHGGGYPFAAGYYGYGIPFAGYGNYGFGYGYGGYWPYGYYGGYPYGWYGYGFGPDYGCGPGMGNACLTNPWYPRPFYFGGW